MLKKSWLFLLPLVAAGLLSTAAPSQAAGENWVVKAVNTVGCGSGDWRLTTVFSGVDGGRYSAHTVVSAGGLIYMNEDANFAPTDGADEPWDLFATDTYGPTTGTYPIPAGQQMKVTFTLERPKGVVLSSYTLVARSCDSTTILYSGATSRDLDADFVATPTDQCPTLQGFTSSGCPLRDRTLSLKARSGPKRVVGRLDAPGFPSLYVGRTVKIWKVRPGPDRRIATRTTNSFGRFRVGVGKGRYYATSPTFIRPKAGEATRDTSQTVQVR